MKNNITPILLFEPVFFISQNINYIVKKVTITLQACESIGAGSLFSGGDFVSFDGQFWSSSDYMTLIVGTSVKIYANENTVEYGSRYYAFVGWYTARTGGSPVLVDYFDGITVPNADTTYYARFMRL